MGGAWAGGVGALWHAALALSSRVVWSRGRCRIVAFRLSQHTCHERQLAIRYPDQRVCKLLRRSLYVLLTRFGRRGTEGPTFRGEKSLVAVEEAGEGRGQIWECSSRAAIYGV